MGKGGQETHICGYLVQRLQKLTPSTQESSRAGQGSSKEEVHQWAVQHYVPLSASSLTKVKFRETLCESGRCINPLKKRGRALEKRGRALKKRGRVLKKRGRVLKRRGFSKRKRRWAASSGGEGGFLRRGVLKSLEFPRSSLVRSAIQLFY